MKQLSLYYHTIRYLRLRQIYGRVWFKLHKPYVRLGKFTSEPELPLVKIPFLIKPQNFIYTFNKDQALNWRNPTIEKLYLYHLHYFDHLQGDQSQSEPIMQAWIEENPPGSYPGWDSYPLSMRIVNWIKWILSGHKPTVNILLSLMAQADYLSRRLEYHLLGNHLLANAKALLFAGLFFGKMGKIWRKKALSLLESQLEQQILKDGGHIERSTQYHSLILEDLLDCVNLLKTYDEKVPITWSNCISKMSYWLSAMSHADGNIALFNDATLNTAVSPVELFKYAEVLGYYLKPITGSIFLRESGYARLQKNHVQVLIDAAPLGPDYLLGHAHADTFTFELSLNKQRIIVNSGTSTYENNAERSRQRGSLAHNSVVIDHLNSSEIWSSFRVARRAKVSRVSFAIHEARDEMSAEHNGYQCGKMNIVHERSWCLGENELNITDVIRGSGNHNITIPFHLHPELEVENANSHCFIISKDKNKLISVFLDDRFTWRVQASTFHPDFGITLTNWCIVGENRMKLPVEVSHLFVWETMENKS